MTEQQAKVTPAAVAHILEEAGRQIILPALHAPVRTAAKADGSIVTETDLACQQFVEGALAGLDASIAFLSEEMEQQKQLDCLQGGGSAFWCLDPLDGTSNFATGLPLFAISLALFRNGVVDLACTHDPVRRETFTAKKGEGAYLNGNRIHGSTEELLSRAIGCIDLKRLDRRTATILACSRSYRSQRNIGSCALEWAWLAAGRIQFIIHGGEKIWDYAAGSLIAAEAGCRFADFSGEPLFPPDGLSSSVVATCTPALRDGIMRLLDSRGDTD